MHAFAANTSTHGRGDLFSPLKGRNVEMVETVLLSRVIEETHREYRTTGCYCRELD